MSYGLQYFTNFFDTDENKYRLHISQWQFTGVADRKSTRLNSSHSQQSRMPSSA